MWFPGIQNVPALFPKIPTITLTVSPSVAQRLHSFTTYGIRWCEQIVRGPLGICGKTRSITSTHVTSLCFPPVGRSDDDLRRLANAAVPVISPTSAPLLLFILPFVLHSRHPSHRDSQTPPEQSKLTRHRHLPIHPQTQGHRTSRTRQPFPLQPRQIPRK